MSIFNKSTFIQLFDVLFNFLSRKTDFYTGGGDENSAETMLLTAFRKHQTDAVKKAKEKIERKRDDERRLAERRAATKAKEEARFADQPKIRELTDEEAAELENVSTTVEVFGGGLILFRALIFRFYCRRKMINPRSRIDRPMTTRQPTMSRKMIKESCSRMLAMVVISLTINGHKHCPKLRYVTDFI